ncbi:hypothetical protein SAMN05216231_3722 [Virgibacillus salinus]|uniref:Uncharacterized protein n=2 Tax=Virgibacillus salinus TaxID=553311 RepID=A0A1H1GH26_9BACI|nr:hypothetical protein SAMN05216231_3722 [Virgibacillus salinus]
MVVRFCDSNGNDIHEIETQDIIGIISACKGEAVVFPKGHYTYSNHILSFYSKNDDKMSEELIVYLNKS